MMETYFTIESGKIVEQTKFTKWLWELKNGRYLITIEPKNKRTGQQNKYIHAVLFPELAKAFTEVGYDGITPQIAKQIAKARYLTRQNINHTTGEVQEWVKDTHELSTLEMNNFIEEVIRFAAISLNYEIPYPQEQTRIDL